MNYKLTHDIDEFIRFIGNAGTIALDTETTGLSYDARIVLMQAGDEHGNVLMLDCRPFSESLLSKYAINSSTEIGERIYLARKGKVTLIHNSVYDLKILLGNFGLELIPPGDRETKIRDTMLQERILRLDANGYGASLGEVVQRYCFAKLNKDYNNRVARSFATHRGPFSSTQLQYAAEDVLYLHRIDRMQRKAAERLCLLPIFDLENNLTTVLARMEMRGFHLDLNQWQRVNDQSKDRRIEALFAAQKIIGELLGSVQETMFDNVIDNRVIHFLRSPDKIRKYFESTYDINPDNCGKIFLRRMADNGDAVAECILNFRDFDKFLTDFGDKLPGLVDEEGFLHPTFDAIKRTGRMGCSKPNLQNIPARGLYGDEIRSSFTAPPGYVCITSDYGQMELRLLAALSGDPAFREEFLRKNDEGEFIGDPHKLMASRAFGIPIDKVTKAERDPAKTVNFGYAYGISAESLRVQLMSNLRRDYPLEEVHRLMDGFRGTFSRAFEWLEEQKRVTVLQGYTKTPMGRIRWLEVPDRKHPNYNFIYGQLQRIGANTPIQGANADATKVALIECYHALDALGGWSCNTVHDEIVFYVPTQNAMEASNIIKYHMEHAVIGVDTDIPFIVNPEIHGFWKK